MRTAGSARCAELKCSGGGAFRPNRVATATSALPLPPPNDRPPYTEHARMARWLVHQVRETWVPP